MNRNEYLATLKRLLEGLSEEEKRDILYDYEEHFRIGMEEGKTEEQISEELGDVRDTARMYKPDIPVQPSSDSTFASSTNYKSTSNPGSPLRALIVALALGFFNLVFVLGPYIGLAGVLIGFWAAAFGITIGGVGTFIIILFSPIFPSLIDIQGLSYTFAFSVSVGLTCLGLLFAIGDVYLTKWFFNLTIRYVRWNINTIQNRRDDNVYEI